VKLGFWPVDELAVIPDDAVTIVEGSGAHGSESRTRMAG
jgi:hypothetical protein